MRAIWDNMLHSLEIVASVGSVDQNYVVTKIIEKVEQLGREKPILFCLGWKMQTTLPQRKVKKGKIENGYHGIFSKALRKQREMISFKTSTHLQD